MPTYHDTDFALQNYADGTKLLKFDLANLTTATTVTLKAPAFGVSATRTIAAVDVDNAFSVQQTILGGGAILGAAGGSNDAQLTIYNGGGAWIQIKDTLSGGALNLIGNFTGTRTIALPDMSDTLIGRATADTITGVKTFDGAAGGQLSFHGDATAWPGAVFALYDTATASEYSITPGTGGSGGATITLPITSGALALTTSIFPTTGGAVTSTASSGWSLRDTTTATKRLRWVLSGAVGNSSMTIANTAARDYKYDNCAGTVVVVGNEAAAPSTNNLGKVDRTAITAVTAATNLSSATAVVGSYAVHYEMTCTTGTIADGTLTFDVIATGDQGAQTTSSGALPLSTAVTSATNPVRGTIFRYVASGALQYSTTVTGAYTAATTRTALRVRVEYLG